MNGEHVVSINMICCSESLVNPGRIARLFIVLVRFLVRILLARLFFLLREKKTHFILYHSIAKRPLALFGNFQAFFVKMSKVVVDIISVARNSKLLD